MWLSELTLQAIGFHLAGLVVLVTLQGAALAAVARALGDPGPVQDGRLVLAPAPHLDPAGSVAWVLFGLGWGRALAIDPARFGHPWGGAGAIVAAGFALPFLLAVLCGALVPAVLGVVSGTAGLALGALLRSLGDQAIWFALISLVPVPPLVAGVLSAAAGVALSRNLRRALIVLLLGLVASGVARDLLAPAHGTLRALAGVG